MVHLWLILSYEQHQLPIPPVQFLSEVLPVSYNCFSILMRFPEHERSSLLCHKNLSRGGWSESYSSFYLTQETNWREIVVKFREAAVKDFAPSLQQMWVNRSEETYRVTNRSRSFSVQVLYASKRRAQIVACMTVSRLMPPAQFLLSYLHPNGNSEQSITFLSIQYSPLPFELLRATTCECCKFCTISFLFGS